MDSYKLVTVENSLMRVDFLPRMGGRIYRIIHKKSGRNLLHIPTPHEWPSPMGGGYAETVERGGSEDNYTCDVSYVPGGQKIVLTGDIYQRGNMKGARITREVFIPENSMELEIESSCEFLAGQRRGHPRRISGSMAVSLGSIEDISFGFLGGGEMLSESAGGQVSADSRTQRKEFVEEAMPEPGPRGSMSKSYVGKMLKGNGWVMVNKKEGIALVSEFDKSAIDGCGVSFNPAQKIISFRLNGPGRVVEDGDVLKLKQTLRIVDDLDKLNID